MKRYLKGAKRLKKKNVRILERNRARCRTVRRCLKGVEKDIEDIEEVFERDIEKKSEEKFG